MIFLKKTYFLLIVHNPKTTWEEAILKGDTELGFLARKKNKISLCSSSCGARLGVRAHVSWGCGGEGNCGRAVGRAGSSTNQWLLLISPAWV